MTSDPQLVYSLEIKVLDLEAKVASLEKAIERLSREIGAAEPASVPADVLDQIEKGENPVRAVRQHRLMTQKELGERSGIRPNHISAIERGMPYGLKTAKRLSDALEVPVGLLT
ncbi:MAG TPA: helix-turn-helix transcriptional regulator [Hyphomonas sp.]|nr:helix-turn-helix transcriptional regulator [Hyphomonas sp.]